MKMRGNFIEWETKDGDTFKGLSPMPRFEQTPGQVWRPMPEQGGDTIDVLTKLGYTPEQIAELEEKGAVKCYHGEEVPDVIFKSERQEKGEAPCNW